MPHCHCRPGCLSPVRPQDATVATATGVVLAAHVDVTAYPTDGLTSLVSPLSKREAS